MGLLNEIVRHKKKETTYNMRVFPLSTFSDGIKKSRMPGLREVFPKEETNIIGEIKRSFPLYDAEGGRVRIEKSINGEFNHIKIAELYAKYCKAISVLTDEKYFEGRSQDMKDISDRFGIPLLRKDFILPGELGKYQVHEARYYGADMILLIARILEAEDIIELANLAQHYGMNAIVEVDDVKGLDKAYKAGAEIIMVNNRNINTLEIDIQKGMSIANHVGNDKNLGVASGIKSREDIERWNDEGIFPDFWLIGKSILKSQDMGEKLRELRGND